MGANVFFPDYGPSDYPSYAPCDLPRPSALSTDKQAVYEADNQDCYQKQEESRKAYEKNKREYESNKYLFISLANLIALLAVIFITLDPTIVIGLFFGSTLATFFSTWIYFSTKSRTGFAVLVIIFVATVYLLHRSRGSLFGKASPAPQKKK